MPRPKPSEPLIVRSIKLTAKQWARLDALGGPAGLRAYLSEPHAVKVKRNAIIRAELLAGVPVKVLAAKYHISAQSIYNLSPCPKLTSPPGIKLTSPTSAPTQSAKLQSKWIVSSN